MELLACHADSYLQEITVEVLECERVDDEHHVTVSESIYYPGGGGQPADEGCLGGRRILGVVDGQNTRLRLLGEVECGAQLLMEVDWERRFDHMQQHTGQHLLTAVALASFGWRTVAFHLNEDRCDIVVDTAQISRSQLSALEKSVNDEIRRARPVYAVEMAIEDIRGAGVRVGRLPEDSLDTLRVMNIEGVDMNPCGGTHVRNTSELQVIRLIGTDVQRGETRIHFLVGQRVLRTHEAMWLGQSEMNRLLSESPTGHLAAVQRLQQRDKEQGRRIKALKGELAQSIADGLLTKDVAAVYRPEDDMAMLMEIVRRFEDKRPDAVVLAAAGRAPNGVFLLSGPEERIKVIAQLVLSTLNGRGGGRGRRLQGKAASPEQILVVPNQLKGVVS